MPSDTGRYSSDSEYKMLNSPLKWVGGKSRLRKSIIPLIPSHTCYVEPFAGAAWVLFGKPPSPIEIINDIDEELINVFRMVREQPEELIASFEFELVSRSEFTRLASAEISESNQVARAHRFYYLIMAGWGGEARYPRFQTSTSDGGHGNRLIGALKTLKKRIEPIHDRLRAAIIENLDWAECIDKYDKNRRSCIWIHRILGTGQIIGTTCAPKPNTSRLLTAFAPRNASGCFLRMTRLKPVKLLASITSFQLDRLQE